MVPKSKPAIYTTQFNVTELGLIAVSYGGAVYHVANHGAGLERIFDELPIDTFAEIPFLNQSTGRSFAITDSKARFFKTPDESYTLLMASFYKRISGSVEVMSNPHRAEHIFLACIGLKRNDVSDDLALTSKNIDRYFRIEELCRDNNPVPQRKLEPYALTLLKCYHKRNELLNIV